MKQDHPIFDADAHVQEPQTMWSDYLDPGLRHQVVVGTDAVLRVGGQPSVDSWRSAHLTDEQRRRMRPLDMVEKYGDLARRHFDNVSPDLRNNILAFYKDLNAPIATKKHHKEWQRTLSQLQQLKDVQVVSAPAPTPAN